MVAAMVEFAIVLYLSRLWQHEDDMRSKVKTNSGMKKRSATKDDNVGAWMRKQSRLIYSDTLTKKKWIGFNLSTAKIDMAAFVLCLTLYFFFNCTYWMQYLVI